MGHDRWRDELHLARQDAGQLAHLLRRGVPTDGLQLAGSAVLAVTPSEALADVVDELVGSLRARDWLGDVELAAALTNRAAGLPSALTPLAVQLDELAEAVDASGGAASYLDTETGMVWPSELIDLGQGPEDMDVDELIADDSGRWLPVVGQGSHRAYADMERFIAAVEPAALANELREAINEKKPFKAFLSVLERHQAQFTSWHRHRDDAQLGRARHWLADHGYEPTRP